MKIFYFFLSRIFLRKPILVLVIITLFFAINYITFSVMRTLVSAAEGANEVEHFNVPGDFIGNLDPDSTVDFDKISETGIQDVYSRIKNDYSFALFTDGYIAAIPNEHNVEIPVAYMNRKYSDINGFRIESGNLNFRYDLEKLDAIPVLVGKGLVHQYPINSEFSLIDPALDKQVRYAVAGVIEQDSSHSNLYALDSKQYYNFSIVVPITDSFIENAGISFKINGLMDLVLTDTSRSAVQDLGKYIEEKISLKLNFFSQEENNDFYKQYFGSSMTFLLIITTVLLIGIILLSVWSSLTGTQTMVREFTINMLVGMSYRRFKILLFGYHSLLSSIAVLALVVMVVVSRYSAWMRKDAAFMTYGLVGGLMGMDLIALTVALLSNLILILILSQCVIWRIKQVPVSMGVLQ